MPKISMFHDEYYNNNVLLCCKAQITHISCLIPGHLLHDKGNITIRKIPGDLLSTSTMDHHKGMEMCTA